MNTSILAIILGSAGIGSIIAAMVTKNNSDKGQVAQYIVQERKKWRDDLRNEMNNMIYSRNVHEIKKYKAYMQVRLNPIKDAHILKQLDNVIQTYGCSDEWDTYSSLIAQLLKEDWERSKEEITGSTLFKSTGIFFFIISSYLLIFQDFIYYFFIEIFITNNKLAVLLFGLSIYLWICYNVMEIIKKKGLLNHTYKKIRAILNPNENRTEPTNNTVDIHHSNFLYDTKQLNAYFHQLQLYEDNANFKTCYSLIDDELKDLNKLNSMRQTYTTQSETNNQRMTTVSTIIASYGIIFAIVVPFLTVIFPLLSVHIILKVILFFLSAFIAPFILFVSISKSEKIKIEKLDKFQKTLNFIDYCINQNK